MNDDVDSIDLDPAVPGTVIDGKYRIDEVLGSGGFGSVYAATQLDLDRPVALKLLKPERTLDEHQVHRFLREAEIVKTLEHPNTVHLYDFGTTTDGDAYIAYQLLDGQSLHDAMYRGPMPTDRIVRIITQVLKSLAEAHEQGFVHRDIKPANIMLCEYAGESDFVKVLDFGIAKTLMLEKSITQRHELLGTPGYMAPEQIRREEVTPAADTYAVGVVLAEMIRGAHLFEGTHGVAVALKSLQGAELSEDIRQHPLGDVVSRAVNQKAEDRFVDATEMLAAVEAAVADVAESEVAQAAPPPIHAPPPQTSRVPVIAIVLASFFGVAVLGALVVVLLAAAGIGAGLWAVSDEQEDVDARKATESDDDDDDDAKERGELPNVVDGAFSIERDAKPIRGVKFVPEATDLARHIYKDAKLNDLFLVKVDTKGKVAARPGYFVIYNFTSKRATKKKSDKCRVRVQLTEDKIKVFTFEDSGGCKQPFHQPKCSPRSVRKRAHKKGFPKKGPATMRFIRGQWDLVSDNEDKRISVDDDC